MNYGGFFKERLDALRAEGRYRVFAGLERRCGRFPPAFDHRIRPKSRRRRRQTQVLRHSHVHLLLERGLADLHGREAALNFTSGYAANDATLSTLNFSAIYKCHCCRGRAPRPPRSYLSISRSRFDRRRNYALPVRYDDCETWSHA
jgi:7-keto-8-aminopelargonate synthetase-like enzyme